MRSRSPSGHVGSPAGTTAGAQEAMASSLSEGDPSSPLCGPASFKDGLSADLAVYGRDASRIHMETFGAGRTPGTAPKSTPRRAPPGPEPDVHFARSGISAPFGPTHNFARIPRSMRRTHPMVMPNRRVPRLRNGPVIRNCPLRPPTSGTARIRKCPYVCAADVTDSAAPDRVIATVLEPYGRIDAW